MQQLTDQLNEKAAGALVTNTVAEHVERETARLAWPPEPRSDDTAELAQRAPVIIDDKPFAPPHLMGLGEPLVPNDKMSRFDHNALARFMSDPDKPFHDTDYQLKDGTWRYRYAQPLSSRQDCRRSHQPKP